MLEMLLRRLQDCNNVKLEFYDKYTDMSYTLTKAEKELLISLLKKEVTT